MRQSWTDDRLDDLSHRMDERFDQVEGEIKGLRAEVKDQGGELRGEVEGLRAEVKDQGRELRGEVADVQAGLRKEMAGVEARIRSESNEHYARTAEQFGRMHEDMRQISSDVQALHRMTAQIAVGGAATLAAALVGVLLTHL